MQPTQSRQPYLQRHYLAESLDPIHIGTGEFQLGRVDNTIVREPGTNLPKIPGSSIAGVCRAYTAMKFDKYRHRSNGTEYLCAGKGGYGGEKHCGKRDCQVCTAFGFSKGNTSFQGLAQFSDARMLFFPAYSAAGPVWLTSPATLDSAGCTGATNSWSETFEKLGERYASFAPFPDPVNLGWLYLQRATEVPSNVPPAQWRLPGENKLSDIAALAPVLRSLIVVNDRLFSAVVNDQLEVRTSVSISPESGAAEEGALFTAEAIPRACFFTFQVTYLEPDNFRVPGNGNGDGKIAYTIAEIESHVSAGLAMIEFLGLGGVNTRGMGRLQVIH